MNIEQTARQIEALLAEHKELAEDEILRADMVEGCTDAMEIIDLMIDRMGEAETLAEALKARVQELTERRKRLEKRVASLRYGLFKIMQAADLKKVERPTATLFIRAGKAKVIINDETELPDQFFRIKREPALTLIHAAIESGQVVTGATLSNPEPALTVKVA